MEKSFGQLVREKREELGLSQAELAMRAHTTQQSIDRIERDAVARSRSAPEVAAALGIRFPGRGLDIGYDAEFTVEHEDGTKSARYIQFKNGRKISSVKNELMTESAISRDTLVGVPDLPIFASVRGGSFEDSLLVSPEPIDYVKRPEPLAKAKNGYGLYVVGDSMEPAFRQGDLALVHPNIPPKAGDEVIICSQDVNGEHYAVIKLLTRVTAEKWHLKQYNPGPDEPAEFTLDRREWPICHLVVGSYKKR